MYQSLLQKVLVWALLAIFVSAPAWNIASAQVEEPTVSLEDFYFYDKEGKKARLALAPKIVLQFYAPQTDEELAAFLAGLSSIGQKQFGSYLLEVSFLPTIESNDLLWKIKELFKSGKADVAPVFIVSEREAVIDGVLIEPSTVVSVTFMEKSLKRIFSGVSFHQFTPRGKAWHVAFPDLFFLKDAKDPLHALSFVNILRASREAPWIKTVSPSFRFIGNEVTAEVLVGPETGTIGEERTVSLVLSILDTQAIRVEEGLLSGFGEGDFVPKFKELPPPASFFKVTGSRTRHEQKEVFGKTITFSWRFMLYAPELEWVIPAQKIPYLLVEEPRDANSVPTTFFTLAHSSAGSTEKDMPPARLLSASFAKTGGLSGKKAQHSTPPTETFLDGFVFASGGTTESAKMLSAVGLAVILFFTGMFFVKEMSRTGASVCEKEAPFGDAEILFMCDDARNAEGSAAYGIFASIVARMLHECLPEFPETEFSMEKVKRCMSEHEYANALLLGAPFGLLENLANMLSRQYASDAVPDSDEKERIENDILELKGALAARMLERTQEGGAHAGT